MGVAWDTRIVAPVIDMLLVNGTDVLDPSVGERYVVEGDGVYFVAFDVVIALLLLLLLISVLWNNDVGAMVWFTMLAVDCGFIVKVGR